MTKFQAHASCMVLTAHSILLLVVITSRSGGAGAQTLPDEVLASVRGADTDFAKTATNSCAANALTVLPAGTTISCDATNVGADCGSCVSTGSGTYGSNGTPNDFGTGNRQNANSCQGAQMGTCGANGTTPETYSCQNQVFYVVDDEPVMCPTIINMSSQ